MNEPRVVQVKTVKDPRGLLGVVEGLKEVGFDFKRFYFLTELREDSERGGHAHKRLSQCFVALRGGVTIKLEGFGKRHEFRLDSYDKALILPPGYWRELVDFDSDSLVAVLASDYYDQKDYIRNYEEFLSYSRPAPVTKVPYIDLGRHVDAMRGELQKAVDRTFDSGMFIGGSLVEEFEVAFAHYSGAAKAVGVANGYDALELALRARNIGSGHEVIVPAHTFVATALAVVRAGATPILVDVERDSALMDVSQVEALITPRTRAVIPVHLYGHPVDMDPLIEIARRHDLFVLEDAAQSHGAFYKGRRCGSLGDAAAFSFYPTKNLGAYGDAGGVTSGDPDLIAKVKQLGNYGASRKYYHDDLGVNSRLDPMQAAFLLRKLDRLDRWNARRVELARRYIDGLSDIDGLRLPAVRNWAEPVWHVFAVQVAEGRREALESWLAGVGVGTNIHYPLPIHHQKCFSGFRWDPNSFPIAQDLTQSVLSLPLDAFHTDDEIDYVIEQTRNFFKV
ncbi:aminotransferase class I/II-fold pyridoxal phosphate-dependent enzyme [Rhizobium freirei]|uniref:aminotransferase class I/II-fold pyridoxal phosphate-dependent enzyme n=1 Tax=Rhizobium freirei TaxID=1353277 RepID=UPI001427CAFA|nr:aminotransferase class I/II-fold pyridoxal phosphate-dependent enzyme [Rhizobium freirei]